MLQLHERASAVLWQVGGGQLSDALQLLTTRVPFWAAVAGVAAAAAQVMLPPTIAAVATPLAAAHLPLALIATGASFVPAAPKW